jgi:hypothetical protein
MIHLLGKTYVDLGEGDGSFSAITSEQVNRDGDYLVFGSAAQRDTFRARLLSDDSFSRIRPVLEFQKTGTRLFVPKMTEQAAHLDTRVTLNPKRLAEVLVQYYSSVFEKASRAEIEKLLEAHKLNFKYIQYPLTGNTIYLDWQPTWSEQVPVTIDKTKLGFEALLADFLVTKRISPMLAELIREVMRSEVLSDRHEFKWEVSKTLPRLHLLKGDSPSDLDAYLSQYKGVDSLLTDFENLPEEAMELYSNAVFFKRYVPRHFQEVRENFERRMRRTLALCRASDTEVGAFLETEIEDPLSEFLFGTLDTSRVNLFLVGYLCDLYRNKDRSVEAYACL